jgi:hypothetical protein
MFLSIQVNIIGRYLFIRHMKDSNIKPELKNVDLDEQTQQLFLSMSGHFQKDGIQKLIAMVKEAVDEHVTGYE